MRIFKEDQYFRQWWLWLILIITILGVLLPLLVGFEKKSSFSVILAIVITSLIVLLFIFTHLHTRIDQKGISAHFKPFPFFKRFYKWTEIDSIEVRTYKPVSEYGGWGVRGFGKAKAYNVKGYKGIQIVSKSKERFLIGTSEPKKAEKTLNYYKNRTNE